MSRTLFRLAGLSLIVLFACSASFAKKKKEISARLKALQTVVLDGNDRAADYVRRNLSQETCLTLATSASEADAILEVSERTTLCRDRGAGPCLGIMAKLTDLPSKKTLWFVTDDEFASALSVTAHEKAAQWVLWSLNNVCCKGRSSPPPDKP